MGIFDSFKKKAPPPAQKPRFTLLVAGHGIELEPELPVGIAHLATGQLVLGPMNASDAKANGGVFNVIVKPGRAPTAPLDRREVDGLVMFSSGEPDTTLVGLGVGMRSGEGVLRAMRTADHDARWRLVMNDYEIAWPARLTLRADGSPDPRSWPYELALDGSADAFMTLVGPLRGPSQIPAPEQLAAPGMEIFDDGELEGTVHAILWIELAYEHGGVAWRQRFYYLPIDTEGVYLLRVQGRAEQMPELAVAADEIATSFRPR